MSERYATRRQKIAQIIYDKLEGRVNGKWVPIEEAPFEEKE